MDGNYLYLLNRLNLEMKRIIWLFILLLTACSTQNTNKNQQVIKIATAANMQYAIKEIATAFTEETDIKCEIIIGSSGKLTAQIKEGAPYDLFVSANMMYPKSLEKDKMTVGELKVYALGKLVIWTMKEHIKPNLSSLNLSNVKHIAIANTETAPYGIAAMEVLEKQPYFQEIQSKLVFGESISQTNQFITTNSAEIGFTALSTVLSPEAKGKGLWEIVDSELHSPIRQGVAIIDTGNPFSVEFYDFLSSEKAKVILRNYGYDIND